MTTKVETKVASRVAVVTGSNKGIGLAIVRRLCKEFNGDVILTSRDERLGREAVQKLEGEGLKPGYHQLDITSSDSIGKLKTFLIQKYGGLDVLVNNAGIALANDTDAIVPSLQEAKLTMNVNFTGTLNVSRALIPILKPHSRIVNMSSFRGALDRVQQNIQGRLTNQLNTESDLVALMDEYLQHLARGDYKEKGWTNTAYGTTKMGLTALTKVHARELSVSDREDILVNCCCPGWVRTDMTSDKAPLSPDEGAETPVMCALLPAGSPTGEFWKDKKVVEWRGIPQWN